MGQCYTMTNYSSVYPLQTHHHLQNKNKFNHDHKSSIHKNSCGIGSSHSNNSRNKSNSSRVHSSKKIKDLFSIRSIVRERNIIETMRSPALEDLKSKRSKLLDSFKMESSVREPIVLRNTVDTLDSHSDLFSPHSNSNAYEQPKKDNNVTLTVKRFNNTKQLSIMGSSLTTGDNREFEIVPKNYCDSPLPTVTADRGKLLSQSSVIFSKKLNRSLSMRIVMKELEKNVATVDPFDNDIEEEG